MKAGAKPKLRLTNQQACDAFSGELTVLGKSLDKGLDKPLDKPLGKRPKAGVTWSCSGPFLVPVVSILFKFNHVFHVFPLMIQHVFILNHIASWSSWWLDVVGFGSRHLNPQRLPSQRANSQCRCFFSDAFKNVQFQCWKPISRNQNHWKRRNTIESNRKPFDLFCSYWFLPILTLHHVANPDRLQAPKDRKVAAQLLWWQRSLWSDNVLFQWLQHVTVDLNKMTTMVGWIWCSIQTGSYPFFLAMMQATGASRPSALRRRDGNVAQAMNKCTFEFRHILTIKSF